MAYKVFSNGDALTGSELNTYLMNQSVMVFASTTARDAALTAPTEGMVVWLQDANKYVYYTGSAWSDLIIPASSGNAIINGAFDINQRGFTSTTTAGYNFDRWTSYTATGTTTFSAQTFTLGSAPIAGIEAKNYLRLVTSGQSGASAASIAITRMESVRTLAGQTATVSFYARSGSGSPKIGLELQQVFGTGGSPSTQVNTAVSAVTISTSWTRYSATISVPSIAGKTIGTNGDDLLALALWVSAGTDFASRASSIGVQNETFDIWGVQVEAGSSATAFKRNASNIQGELAACQRYYWRSTAIAASPYGIMTNAFGANSSTQAYLATRLPVTMRAIPTSVDYSTLQLADGSNIITVTSVSLDPNTSTQDYVACAYNVSSGLTQYRPYVARANNSANGYLGFSAEL